MRPRSQRAAHLGAVLLAGLGVACVTSVRVAFDEEEDFSSYRTWNWRPDRARTVDAPLGDAPALDAALARFVESALRDQGFTHSPDAADFFVAIHLRVERELVTVNETGAMQVLSSLHDSPSYWIQATKSELRRYESAQLAIVVTDRHRQRRVWRGEFQGRFPGDFAPHLGDAVSRLLERFPPATKPTSSPPRPRPGNAPERAHKQAFSIGVGRVMMGLA